MNTKRFFFVGLIILTTILIFYRYNQIAIQHSEYYFQLNSSVNTKIIVDETNFAERVKKSSDIVKYLSNIGLIDKREDWNPHIIKNGNVHQITWIRHDVKTFTEHEEQQIIDKLQSFFYIIADPNMNME